MCSADAGQLWTASLCGPLIVVDGQTRAVWATQRDNTGVLTLTPGGGWVGTLPPGVPVANTSVDWGGARLDHGCWSVTGGRNGAARPGCSRGLAPHSISNRPADAERECAHLETERGRYLMRLELRALSTAMLSSGRARRNAARDALGFRASRLASFAEAPGAEAGLDRNEGLASYTGVRLGAGETAHLFAARTINTYDQSQALARSYAYASGPAYGLLLDEFAPNWRTMLGAYAPADLLVGPVRAQMPRARDLARAAERYGGQQIAAEERTRAENQRRVIAELTARFSGHA
jgi:hypothetical protein